MYEHRLAALLAAGITIAIAIQSANSAAADAAKAVAKPKAVSAKTLARGKYMVQTGHCNNCHTSGYTRSEGKIPEKDWLLGSTPLGYRGPWGTTYATNLRLTLPKFTQEQWVSYAKTMKARPPMPWWPLRDTTDADLAAMYQYIKHLGPAGQMAPDFVPPDKEPKPPYEKRELVK
jgi:mono/diheme cytochrome c family protein